MSQAFSFVRAFATVLGWKREDEWVQNNDAELVIDDHNINTSFADLLAASSLKTSAQAALANDAQAQTDVAFMQKIHVKNQPQAIDSLALHNMRLELGNDAFDDGYAYSNNIDVDRTALVPSPSGNDDGQWTAVSGGNQINLGRITSWIDYTHPGTVMQDIEAGTKGFFNFASEHVHRLMTNNGLEQIYPKIASNKLETDFLPAIQGILNQLLKFFDPSDTSIYSMVFGPDFVSLLNFLYQYTATNNHQFTSQQVADVVTKNLNNGSHHLLAIAAFWYGFDASFLDSNPYINTTFSWPSGKPQAQWREGTQLVGFKDITDVLSLQSWSNMQAWQWTTNNQISRVAWAPHTLAYSLYQTAQWVAPGSPSWTTYSII